VDDTIGEVKDGGVRGFLLLFDSGLFRVVGGGLFSVFSGLGVGRVVFF
jgi:hypothetical protein